MGIPSPLPVPVTTPNAPISRTVPHWRNQGHCLSTTKEQIRLRGRRREGSRRLHLDFAGQLSDQPGPPHSLPMPPGTVEPAPPPGPLCCTHPLGHLRRPLGDCDALDSFLGPLGGLPQVLERQTLFAMVAAVGRTRARRRAAGPHRLCRQSRGLAGDCDSGLTPKCTTQSAGTYGLERETRAHETRCDPELRQAGKVSANRHPGYEERTRQGHSPECQTRWDLMGLPRFARRTGRFVGVWYSLSGSMPRRS